MDSRDRDGFFIQLPEPHHEALLARLPAGSTLELVRRANHTLAVLAELNESRLTNRSRGIGTHHDRGRFFRAGEASQRASLMILERWIARPPTPGRPRGESALSQILGARARSTAYGMVSGPPGPGPLRKGDLCHAVPWAISLPAPGHKAVNLCDISPRCAAILADMEDVMRRPPDEAAAARAAASIKAFTDPGISSKRDRLWLALRMWLGGMIETTDDPRAFCDIFTVVKKVWPDAGPLGNTPLPARGRSKIRKHPGPILGRDADPVELQQRLVELGVAERPVRSGAQFVQLRAVFDERANNLDWKKPPWCSLASVEAVSQLDFSDLSQQGYVAEAACGDVADWYYRLRTPPALQRYFCLQGISTADFHELLTNCGFAADFSPDKSRVLCVSVLVMGFSWAVYFAQTALEDTLDRVGGVFSYQKRLVHSVQVQAVSEQTPMGAWGYIDDFGVLGMRPPEGDNPVQAAAAEAASELRSLGFVVHKEQSGSSVESLGMHMGEPPEGCRFSRIVVRGTDEKVWACYEALLCLAARDRADAKELESVVALATWLVLPARPALAVFSSVYAFIQSYREAGVQPLWDSARNELGGMAGLLVLAEARLDRPWDDNVYMVDASPSGGAVLLSTATPDEIQSEARLGQYGGWQRWLDALAKDGGALDGYEDEFTSLAAAASAAPLPRLPPKVPVARLFVVFSGVRREGDLADQWSREAQALGMLGLTVLVDVRFGAEFDLRCPDKRASLLRRIRAEADAYQAAPPCSTWSRVRHRPGGPPPLRSRSEPWGVPGLSHRLRSHVDEHSDLLKFSWDGAVATAAAGGVFLVEHPADPGEPYASSWATSYVRAQEALAGADRFHCDQCTLGAPSMKPTTFSTNVPAGVMREEGLTGSCPGVSASHQHVSLLGKRSDGTFNTQRAQEYTPELCSAIARGLLRGLLRRRADGAQPMISVTPSRTDVQQAQDDWLEKERRANEKKQVPAVGTHWDDKSRWQTVIRIDWKHDEHNNITEARTALLAVRRQARRMQSWNRRVLVIGDSQVAIGVLSKGRSSSWGLLRQCRKLAALHLGLGITLVLRYVPTDRNLADGPSRGWRIGVAPKTSPAWPLAAPEAEADSDQPQKDEYSRRWAGFG